MQREEAFVCEEGLPGAAVSTAPTVYAARRMLQEMYQKHHLHTDERFARQLYETRRINLANQLDLDFQAAAS